MNLAYLLIGGNLGDRIVNLTRAARLVEKEIGKIVRMSSIYETASWGITGQPHFLNQVLAVETKLPAQPLLHKILFIENKMGRIRSEKNASRIIDIDILFFNDEVIEKPGITIPHPEIQNRRFALVPMDEIAPDMVHPLLKSSIKELLSTSKDKLEVKLLANQ